MTDHEDGCFYCQLLDDLAEAFHPDENGVVEDPAKAVSAVGAILGVIIAAVLAQRGEAAGLSMLNVFTSDYATVLRAAGRDQAEQLPGGTSVH